MTTIKALDQALERLEASQQAISQRERDWQQRLQQALQEPPERRTRDRRPARGGLAGESRQD